VMIATFSFATESSFAAEFVVRLPRCCA